MPIPLVPARSLVSDASRRRVSLATSRNVPPPWWRRLGLGAVFFLFLVAWVRPSPVGAQAAQSAPAARPVVRSLLGDMGFEIRINGPGALSIGVADSGQSASLDVRASDARRWADSASRLISSPVRRARATKAGDGVAVTRYRATLEEPGTGSGSLVLARADSAGKASFVFFAADADLVGVRQPLDAADARLLVRLVRRAVTAALPPRPRRATPRPGVKPKPAVPPVPSRRPGDHAP